MATITINFKTFCNSLTDSSSELSIIIDNFDEYVTYLADNTREYNHNVEVNTHDSDLESYSYVVTESSYDDLENAHNFMQKYNDFWKWYS